MAAPWIKWSKGLTQKREVLLLAAELGINVYEVAGRLMRFMEWLDDNVTSREVDAEGNARVTLGALPLALVDSLSGVTGFGAALESVGWLSVDGRDLVVVHFGRHNGETAKSRALGAVRAANHKSRRAASNAIGNGASVTDALPRGEEIREEESRESGCASSECRPSAAKPTEEDPLAHETAIIELPPSAVPEPQRNSWEVWEPTPATSNPRLVAAIREWERFVYTETGKRLNPQRVDKELAARKAEGWNIDKLIRSVEVTIRWSTSGGLRLLDPDIDFEKASKQKTQGTHYQITKTDAEKAAG